MRACLAMRSSTANPFPTTSSSHAVSQWPCQGAHGPSPSPHTTLGASCPLYVYKSVCAMQGTPPCVPRVCPSGSRPSGAGRPPAGTTRAPTAKTPTLGHSYGHHSSKRSVSQATPLRHFPPVSPRRLSVSRVRVCVCVQLQKFALGLDLSLCLPPPSWDMDDDDDDDLPPPRPHGGGGPRGNNGNGAHDGDGNNGPADDFFVDAVEDFDAAPV